LLAAAAIQRNIRASYRPTVRVGPFTVKLHPTSDNPYFSYAVPDDGADPTPAEVDALVAVFAGEGRVPRLEYVPVVAPAVEDALLRRGFVVENRLAVLTCEPGALRPPAVPEGFELIVPESDDELAGDVAVTNEAYAGDTSPPSETAIADRRAFRARGGIVVLARVAASGEPAGSGICEVPVDGASEVATIGVRPAFRRRGLAGAVTARLAAEAFAVGVELLWLQPLHEEGERIYRAVGFAPATDILHIRRP
jgi:ribosomal protein S18 acetylase RimI-like enzyme